ncbi:MAG: N-acetyltransferase [Planctomycetota bacterium]
MIRKAKISDVSEVVSLINIFADEGKMLPRPLSEIYEQLRDFYVCEENGELVGCAALHIAWEDLAEIRSLAVRRDDQGRGLGKELVQHCLEEARHLEVKRIFALTYTPEFFEKLGFTEHPKEELPHKIWTDCLKCPKFPNCDEVAVILEL